MSLTYGFYDSLNGDRKYNAIQWSSIFDGVINDGVFASIGTCFLATATGSNMVITVGSGRAWFDHTWFLSDGDPNNPITFTWDAAHNLAPEPVNTRIDAIVFETNSNPNIRANSIKVVKGDPTTGLKPGMTHTAYINQYPIAYVTIGAGVTSINQANIENAVGTSSTPFVTGILQVISADSLIAQWSTDYANWRATQQASFTTWYATLQEWLTPSESATFAQEIMALEGMKTATFLAAGWTQIGSTGIYSQRAVCGGMDGDWNPTLVRYVSNTATVNDIKAYNKAFTCITSAIDGVTEDGFVTLYVIKVPATDITVGFKGR